MNKAEIVIHSKAGEVVYSKTHTAPASWDELTSRDLLLWASALSSKLKLDIAKIALAALLYRIPEKVFVCVPRSEARRLTRSVDFLHGKNMLGKWLIPSFWFWLRKYHGPKSMLANLTVAEFSLCEYCYEQYEATNKTDYLDTLAAILYRPRRKHGIDEDIRAKLTNYGYVRRAKRFKRLPVRMKVAIYLNYEGCRLCLQKKYPDVWKVKGTGKLFEAIRKTTFTNWDKIAESAANDIFGTLQMTREANLHAFLSRLGTRIVEFEKLEALKNK